MEKQPDDTLGCTAAPGRHMVRSWFFSSFFSWSFESVGEGGFFPYAMHDMSTRHDDTPDVVGTTGPRGQAFLAGSADAVSKVGRI